MNRQTFTSKTGITAILSMLGTGIGMYTGAVPIIAGVQLLLPSLLGLFVRDAIASQDGKIEDATQAAENAGRSANSANVAASAAATQSNKVYELANDRRIKPASTNTDSRGGA